MYSSVHYISLTLTTVPGSTTHYTLMNTITDDCIIHYMYCNVRTTGTLVHVMKKDNYVIHDSIG